MVNVQEKICPGEWDAQTPLGFWDTNESPNLGQTTWPYDNQQKKKTCRIENLADYWVNWKKAKRRISTSSLLENWKNGVTWEWRWYQ